MLPTPGDLPALRLFTADSTFFSTDGLFLPSLELWVFCSVGEWGWGIEGKQVGSMDEESQVRGCYNITLFVYQPTRKQCLF